MLTELSDVAFVYHMNIDSRGHEFGPESDEIKEAVKDVDEVFKTFLDHLENEGKGDEINFIVVADHGMTDKSKVVEIKLSHYLTEESLEAIEYIVDSGE